MVEGCNSFIGKGSQTDAPHIFIKPLIEKRPRKRAKVYPVFREEKAPRNFSCHNITLTKFEPPYFSAKIHCDGNFSPRSFVNKLAMNFNTCAHVVDLQREQLGLLKISDGLLKHQLYWNQIKEAIEKHSDITIEYLKQFEDKI